MESGSQKLSEKGKVSKVRAKDKNDWRDSYETTQPMQTSKKKKMMMIPWMYIKKNMNVAKLRQLKTKIDVFIFQLNINAYTINDEYSNHKETSQSTFIC